MPAFREEHLSNEDAWHLVNYVLSISPPELRDKQVLRRPPPLDLKGEALPPKPKQPPGPKGGLLQGRFIFEGRRPETPPLTVAHDHAVCGETAVDESLVIGDDAGLANVLVFVRTRDIPTTDPPRRRKKQRVELTIKDCRFSPHVLTVVLGDELLVKNEDPVGHNVNITGSSAELVNRSLASKSGLNHVFKRGQRQPLQVSNAIHPHMSAYVLSHDNPYAAVTDQTGRFRIEQLPVGVGLEFQVRHERAKTGLATEKWRFGRFELEFKEGETVDLKDIVVTPEMIR